MFGGLVILAIVLKYAVDAYLVVNDKTPAGSWVTLKDDEVDE